MTPAETRANMKARLIQHINGEWLTSEFAAADLIPAMKARGFKHTGTNRNTIQREELQGWPRFAGVAGPMWDDGAIRYEDRAAYEALSL